MAETAGDTPTAKRLHWLILALLIVQFARMLPGGYS